MFEICFLCSFRFQHPLDNLGYAKIPGGEAISPAQNGAKRTAMELQQSDGCTAQIHTLNTFNTFNTFNAQPSLTSEKVLPSYGASALYGLGWCSMTGALPEVRPTIQKAKTSAGSGCSDPSAMR